MAKIKYQSDGLFALTPCPYEIKAGYSVVLQVDYDPFVHPKFNNYITDCWQIRVYEPILLEKIKRLI